MFNFKTRRSRQREKALANQREIVKLLGGIQELLIKSNETAQRVASDVKDLQGATRSANNGRRIALHNYE